MVFGNFSPPSRAEGAADGRRDTRADLRADQISAYVLHDNVDDRLPHGDEEEIDQWDALDAQEHRKKMHAWSLSSRRRTARSEYVEEKRPSLTARHTGTILKRNVAIPNAVWTIGDNSLGQCGRASASNISLAVVNAPAR